MNASDRIVLVRAAALDDLCALADQACDDITLRRGVDPLASSLRGAIAEVRAHSVLDAVR